MGFTNENHRILFYLGKVPVYLTDTLIATWVVMGVLIALAVAVRLSLRRFKGVPRGFQNIIETLVEMMDNFTASTMGPGTEAFGAYFFGVFAFILLSNYIGLVGLRQPTADLGTTAALALLTFVIIHANGLRKLRGKYFKAYLSPSPIMLPINLMGELSKPISLAFRLFGNMLAGVIIMALVYGMLPIALRFILPDILHAYFDIFAGALQAFIFTVLSMTFIAQQAQGA